MKSIKIALLIILSSMLFSMANEKTAKLGEMAPDFTLVSAEGNTHSLSDFKGKYVVLEWVNYGCPFVVKHYGSNNMQTLQKEMTDKDVVWLSICSSAPGKEGFFKGDDLKKQIKANKANHTAYLQDADGKVGKMYNARNTPVMYIVNPDGKLVYTGGIDDIASADQADVKKAKNYVRAAMTELMDGKAVTNASTRPYGCSVKYAKK